MYLHRAGPPIFPYDFVSLAVTGGGEPCRVLVFMSGDDAEQVAVGLCAKDFRAIAIAMQKARWEDGTALAGGI